MINFRAYFLPSHKRYQMLRKFSVIPHFTNFLTFSSHKNGWLEDVFTFQKTLCLKTLQCSLVPLTINKKLFFAFFTNALIFKKNRISQKKMTKIMLLPILKSFIPDVRISKLNRMSDFCENEHMEFHSIQQSMFPILCDPILIKSSSAAHNSRNSIFAMTRKLYCWSIPDTPFPAKIYLQILIKSRSRRNGHCFRFV